MFGKNVVSHKRSDMFTYHVTEIFYTIQGEGPYAGMPAVFVRFTGCNLRCFFCDTDFESGRLYLQDSLARKIVNLLDKHNALLVVMTGGEPMLQNIPGLIEAIRETPYYRKRLITQIETAGTVWRHEFIDLMSEVTFVLSPKTPKIAQAFMLRDDVHYKYVIDAERVSETDGLPVDSTQTRQMNGRVPIYRPDWRFTRPHEVFVQPCDTGDAARNAANLAATAQIALKYGYRLSVQLHKIAALP